MKNPINTWSLKYVQLLTRKSACIGKPISYTFTSFDKQQAITTLRTLYPNGGINSSFVDRILYLSELY
jgi:hypothetical protein